MRRSRWTPEQTAALLKLVGEGLDRRVIAARMGLIINAVTTKLHTMGLVVPLGASPKAAPSAADRATAFLRPHPPFEDITLAEASAVRAGAPPCARMPRPSRCSADVSLTGSTAALCLH